MANKSKWRMAFDKSKFTLEYNEPIRIVHCAWISDPESSSLLPFLIYRIIITGLFLAVLGWSWHIFWDSGKWFIFLTNWGFLMCGLQSLIGTLLVIVAYWKQKTVNIIDSIFDLSHDDTKMPISYKIYWIFYNIAVTVAFFITLLYWTILYNPDESKESNGPFGLNLATHAGNSILCALDLIICGIPSQFLHVIHPLLFLLLYTIFNLVYWATGGLGPDGETYIYPVLDWDNNPGLGVGIIFGGAALIFVLHAFVCFIAELRTMLTLKIWRRSENNIMISTRPVLSEGSSNKGFVI